MRCLNWYYVPVGRAIFFEDKGKITAQKEIGDNKTQNDIFI